MCLELSQVWKGLFLSNSIASTLVCDMRNILRRLRDRIQFAARQFVPGRGESDEHIRRICEERTTKPWDKVTAAQRVALLLASGSVAPRSQPHWRGCSLVAPSQKPRATQQTVFYPGVSSVTLRAAFRMAERKWSPRSGKSRLSVTSLVAPKRIHAIFMTVALV